MTYKPLDLSKYEGHTPGPWVYDETNLGQVFENCVGITTEWDGAKFSTVSTVAHAPAANRRDSPESASEKDANARLIAAATTILTDARAARKVIGELHKALNDARGGMRYIRQAHGELYGVGFDRVEQESSAALALAAPWVEQKEETKG